MQLTYVSTRGRSFDLTVAGGKVTYTITEPTGRRVPHSGLSLAEAKDVMDMDIQDEARLCAHLDRAFMTAG